MSQAMAFTGSVNQHGQIPVVDRVCENIKGIFDSCGARGLDGSHGVIIPAIDAVDLMLREDLLEAAEAGLFHVYAIDHVEQAMELLTGLLAGVADDTGNLPEGEHQWSHPVPSCEMDSPAATLCRAGEVR
ncbi:MAG TPA: hypothetical protein EYP90_14080 [Chromatiaceae bacterium]|nr:hypothetical protein [Chromatiaceae bacterium]